MTDVSRLKATLIQSGVQTSNSALHQTILGLINAIEGISTTKTVPQITTLEVDTTAAAVSITLKNQVKGLTLIRDKNGHAGTHNITLIGTVDGVVNPVINTNYGIFRVHPSGVAFGTW